MAVNWTNLKWGVFVWGWYCSYRIFVAVSKFRNLLQHALHKFAVFSRVAILAGIHTLVFLQYYSLL